MRFQGGVVDRGRPPLAEHLRLGVDRDIGINQRTTTYASAQGDTHIAKVAKVQPAVLLLRLTFVPQPVALADTGVVLDRPAPTALQHQYPGTLLRQSASHHRTAKATANHNGIEITHAHFLVGSLILIFQMVGI